MFVLPPQAGQVTTRQSGEPHIVPLDKCPKCDKPIGYLSVNNGFTTPADKGKLQQWCTPCGVVIFYTAAYTAADAEKLLRRVEERNTAVKYKLLAPQQEEFLPEPMVSLVPQTSRGCVNEHCSKPRNKDCMYLMCKRCCHSRPALDKLCVKHHGDTGSSQPQTVVTPPPPQAPPPAKPPTQTTQATMLPPVSNDHIPEIISRIPNDPAPLSLPSNTRPVHRQPLSQRSAGLLLEERIAAPRSDFASSGANISRRRAEGLQMSRNQCSIYIWLADGTPPIPFQVVLPLFPQFTLHELEAPLSQFNPDGLPIEVYMPTTCEWEVIIDPQWPVTMITGMKQILLSLRPGYTKQFQDKPRLDELLGRQPRKGPTSKRAAASDLVSPRKPKLLRSMPPSAKATPMATLSTLHDNNGTLSPPLPQSSPPRSPPTSSPPPSSPPPSSPPQLPPPTPIRKLQISDENQRAQALRFPAGFLACDILKGTSQYMVDRHGKHGRFREIFRQIFGRNYSKTTEANLPSNYPKAYARFRTLDYDTQTTITWNELMKSCDNTAPSSMRFIPFTPPVRLHTPTPPTPPLSTRGLTTPINNLPSPSLSTLPVILPLPPMGHPVVALSPPRLTVQVPSNAETLQPLDCGEQGVLNANVVSVPPQPPAQFPLDPEILRPLDPDERAVLDANAALIYATRATLGDGIDVCSDDCTPSQELVGLRCPFCDTRLLGKHYSDALLAMLNSPMIQEHTTHDPTDDNPNHRRSLIGPDVYSNFCAQHVLEELTPVAQLHGWPYPPDFSTLPQRIKDKRGFLDAVIIGTTTGVDVSTFFLNLLTMNDKQRYSQSLDIISAGYYGLTGVRLILMELRLMYPTLACNFELPDGISWNTFTQYVLVPEVVGALISEDMCVTLGEADRIRKESREFGFRAFPDELD